ncbi:hypothetical protein [Nonomuraea basaltis]|uniref:hypothetical protein n=1 Tax=Nonomuraea basaltis TaxID=2495887 RepID=UPI00110C6883|nr:hypothetical protein [Nonomuraea basaltis]TMR88786.1 hypothetical protein EJK15_64330 [Nonomuraea basaltis]
MTVMLLVVAAPAAVMAAPASAITLCETPETENNWDLPGLPFTYICEYGYIEHSFQGRGHIFIVDQNSVPLHTWQTSINGPWYESWVGLGGEARSQIYPYNCTYQGRQCLRLEVVGTDGVWYCKWYDAYTVGYWWPSQNEWAYC